MSQVALCVALLAAVVAGAFAKSSQHVVGSYTVVMDDSPKFEFWDTEEGRPKKGTERNWVSFKNIKMCNGNSDECQQVDFPALPWVDATAKQSAGASGDDATLTFMAPGIAGVHPFTSLQISVGLQTDGDDEFVHTQLQVFGHTIPYGEATTYKVTLQRSHNADMTFTAGKRGRFGKTNFLISGDQQGNQVYATFSPGASGTDNLQTELGRFGKTSRIDIATGIAGAGAAAGAVVIVGALAFRAWRTKSKNEEFEPIEMALP